MNDRQLVVGAIIVDSLDAPTWLLAARRSRPEDLKGLWEFPGGKVEPGETPATALVREVAEELGVQIDLGEELVNESGSWPISDRLHLRLFFAVIAEGEPTPGDSHDELRELAFNELDEVAWLPSDRLAVDILASRSG
jgi:8-oxo-dGTP diphosphatase